jgi:hypothetical protein
MGCTAAAAEGSRTGLLLRLAQPGWAPVLAFAIDLGL